jgi:hypothetical protein
MVTLQPSLHDNREDIMKTFWTVGAALLAAFLFSGRASSDTLKDAQFDQFQTGMVTQADVIRILG